MVSKKPYDHLSQYGVDLFSLSHLAMGIIIYAILAATTNLAEWAILLIDLAIGIVWEPVENYLLIKWKWNQQKDSILNVICDILKYLHFR